MANRARDCRVVCDFSEQGDPKTEAEEKEKDNLVRERCSKVRKDSGKQAAPVPEHVGRPAGCTCGCATLGLNVLTCVFIYDFNEGEGAETRGYFHLRDRARGKNKRGRSASKRSCLGDRRLNRRPIISSVETI